MPTDFADVEEALPLQPTFAPSYTRDEVRRHCTSLSCWVIVDGSVYDVTEFLTEHPGGALALCKPGRAVAM